MEVIQYFFGALIVVGFLLILKVPIEDTFKAKRQDWIPFSGLYWKPSKAGRLRISIGWAIVTLGILGLIIIPGFLS
jgi:hypothetical protein